MLTVTKHDLAAIAESVAVPARAHQIVQIQNLHIGVIVRCLPEISAYRLDHPRAARRFAGSTVDTKFR